MIEITFLGTSGGAPTKDRGMPAIAVKFGPELLLWDCGEGTQRQMMKYKIGYGSINAIMISHPHLDHFLGMYGLLETLKLSLPSPKQIRLIVPHTVDTSLAQRYKFAEINHIKSGVIYDHHDFTVSAFQVKHCGGSYGFLIKEKDRRKFHEEKAHSLGLKGKMFREIQKKGSLLVNTKQVLFDEVSYVVPGKKIVYSGDCLPSDSTVKAAEHAELLIHEATFDSSMEKDAEERSHSTITGAAELAKKAKVKQLIITHISPRYSDVIALTEQAQKIFKKSTIAFDGLKIGV